MLSVEEMGEDAGNEHAKLEGTSLSSSGTTGVAMSQDVTVEMLSEMVVPNVAEATAATDVAGGKRAVKTCLITPSMR